MKTAAIKVYGTRDADAFCFPSSPPDDGSDVKPDRLLEPRAICMHYPGSKEMPSLLLAETAQNIASICSCCKNQLKYVGVLIDSLYFLYNKLPVFHSITREFLLRGRI